MRHFKILSALGSGVLVLALASPAVAQPRGGGGRSSDGPRMRANQMMEDLGLSQDQEAKIKAIREAQRPKMQANRSEMKQVGQQLKDKRKELGSAMQSDASESSLKSKFDEIQKLKKKAFDQRQKTEALRFDNSLEIRKILTPEQRKKFRGFMKEAREGKSGKMRKMPKGWKMKGAPEDDDFDGEE